MFGNGEFAGDIPTVERSSNGEGNSYKYTKPKENWSITMIAFHDKLVKLIAELCEECKTSSHKEYYSVVYADHLKEREYKPLVVARAKRRQKPLAENYHADVWAKRQNRKIDVYEVWHSETIDEAITDIFLSSMVKNIDHFHVVCTGYNITADRAADLVDIVLLSVRNEDGEVLLSPENTYVTEIPDEIDRRKLNELKKYLREELGF